MSNVKCSQCVILAAGKGTRMGELTKDTPKPLLKIGDKNLIELKLDLLPPEVEEVILVVGYLGEKIKEYFGDNFVGRRIKYVNHEKLDGTGTALWLCQELLEQRFMVMMGDDLYDRQDLLECLKFEWAMLVKKSIGKPMGGVIVADEEGNLKNIIEGTDLVNNPIKEGEEFLINTGLYILNKEIFKYPLVKLPGKEEFGLPQTMVSAVHDFKIKLAKAHYWEIINSVEDLERARKQ